MAIIPRGLVRGCTANLCFTASHSELVGMKIVGRSICTNSITVAKVNLRTGIVGYFVHLDCCTQIDDVFQVKNEEMICGNIPMDYELLDNFFSERNDTDFRSKVLSFSTLIPPPASRQSHKVHRVIVTEINLDLLCSYVSPCTIQDPVYVNFDDNMIQLHLDDPHFSTDDKDFSHIKFRWHHQCLLSSLTGIMKDYGKVESTLSFATFKYKLLSVYDKAEIAYDDACEDFFENFIISIMTHCMRHRMKEINEEMVWLKKDKHDDFWLLYSPSIVHLLSALNMFRRSLCKQVQLTDKTPICEKSGLMIGCLLMERSNLLGDVDNVVSGIRLNESGHCNINCLLGPTPMYRDDHKMISHVQYKLIILQTLFDVYKLVSIELHR